MVELKEIEFYDLNSQPISPRELRNLHGRPGSEHYWQFIDIPEEFFNEFTYIWDNLVTAYSENELEQDYIFSLVWQYYHEYYEIPDTIAELISKLTQVEFMKE